MIELSAEQADATGPADVVGPTQTKPEATAGARPETPKMFAASFRAMGSPCRIVVNDEARSAAVEAQNLIAELEGRWSRFLLDSEISQLNQQAGNMVVVSPATYTLVETACVARAATGGVFNPLMLSQLQDLGYSEAWVDAVSCSKNGNPDQKLDEGPIPTSSEEIQLFPELSAVCLPPGTQFDPGGIGKGLAADMATDLLLAAGATTTSVELGGDVRVSGRPWYGPSWRIGVTHPFDDNAEVAAFTPESGAVATSSRLGRCWEVGGEARHHLLDPDTGRSAQTDLVSSTACAETAWWAEVVAKVILIAGSDAANLRWSDLSTRGIAVTSTGAVLQSQTEPSAARFEQQETHEEVIAADGSVGAAGLEREVVNEEALEELTVDSTEGVMA